MNPFPGEVLIYKVVYRTHVPKARLRRWLVRRSYARLGRSVEELSRAFQRLGAAMCASLSNIESGHLLGGDLYIHRRSLDSPHIEVD